MTTRPGRPLRALAGFAVVMTLWFAARLPGLEERYAAGVLAMQQVGAAAQHRPLPLAGEVERRAFWRGLGEGVLVSGLKHTLTRRTCDGGRLRDAVRLASPASGGGKKSPVAQSPLSSPIAQAAVVLPPAPAANPGFDLATHAYAQLAAGNRHAADRLFGEAIATGDSPNVAAWTRERRRLNRRWSGDAYTLFRDASLAADGAAASPVLGGGQSGGSIAWAIDPLANQPLAILGRLYAAHDARTRIDGDTAQAAIGVRWQPVPGVSIAAERLIAIGKFTSSDWNLRVAAGGERRVGYLVLDGYGEAGVRGNGDVYAGGQARAALPLGAAAGVAFSAGPGVWGSIQSAANTVSRVDLGIGVSGRLPVGVAVSADWRWRVAGNAAPVSGPAVTVSMAF